MFSLMLFYAESYAVSYALLGESIVRFCPWSVVDVMGSLVQSLMLTKALHMLVSTKVPNQDLHQDL